MSAYTTATNRGAKLKLVNLPAKVTDILTITQLITVFDVYDSEAEARPVLRLRPATRGGAAPRPPAGRGSGRPGPGG